MGTTKRTQKQLVSGRVVGQLKTNLWHRFQALTDQDDSDSDNDVPKKRKKTSKKAKRSNPNPSSEDNVPITQAPAVSLVVARVIQKRISEVSF